MIIKVDLPADDADETFIVCGQILGQGRKPLAGVTIKAFDLDFRAEKLLGETVTDTEGRYDITYKKKQLTRHGKTRAHLIIRAFTADQVLLGESETHFNADPEEQVDLVVTAPPEADLPEFERLSARLSRVSSGAPLGSLTDSDIEFLAADTGIAQETIALLNKSGHLSTATGLPADILYAWGHANIQLDLDSLLAEDWDVLQAAVTRAVDGQLISPDQTESIERLKGRIEQLRLDKGLLVRHEFVGRLIDEEKQRPLKGYKVNAHDLDADEGPRDLGFDTTGQGGLFSFTYIVAPPSPEEGEPSADTVRRLGLHILDSQDEEIYYTEVQAQRGPSEPLTINVPVPHAPDPADVSLRSFTATHGIDLPADLLQSLEQRGLSTLKALREAGGLSRLKDLSPISDAEQVRTLDAHVNLSALTDDYELNSKLIAQGLTSIASIARLTRSSFLTRIAGLVKEEIAAALHAAARAQSLYLANLYAAIRVDLANGRKNPLLEDFQEIAPEDMFPEHCECKDCESAVSPLAYLADLLDYTLNHVQVEGTPISLQGLESRFHQPFGDLPATCEAVANKVPQVRICVEALRGGLARRTEKLEKAEREYALDAYQHLLTRFGTSYEELRLASTADRETRRALAERLGVDYRTWYRSPLWYILLRPEEVNERVLEAMFGLADTNQHPLSTGTKFEDEENQLPRWTLSGVVWGRNTEPDGQVYVELTQPETSIYRIELFRDESLNELIATGQRATPTGLVAVAEKNGSGLSGTVEIRYSTEVRLGIHAIPFLLSARLKHLRTLWSNQDWPDDPYWPDAPAATRLPIIDPDLIGPDDFRHPVAGDPAFDLWIARREQVDDALEELEHSPVAKMLPALLQKTLGVPIEELNDLAEEVRVGDDPDKIQEQVVDELHLTPEGLTRLMELHAVYALDTTSPPERLTDAQWREVYSILVQRTKTEWIANPDGWIAREQEIGIRLDPKTFWQSLEEPEVGDWPPLSSDRPLPVTYPLIDPDLVAQKDLPEPTVGKEAARLWQARAESLAALRRELKETEGLEAKLAFAFGYPLPHDLNQLQEQLNGDIPRATEAAKQAILSDLCMTIDDFTRLMELRRELGEVGKGREAMRKEWTELDAILVSAKKVRTLYSPWVAEEEGLTYWLALKARLPEWRASIEARQKWLRALDSRSRSPAIDPDLIDWQYFTNPAITTVAKLRNQRSKWLEYTLARLNRYPRDLEGLGNRIRDVVGPLIDNDDLAELKKKADEGEAIDSRLEQINLTFEALQRLVAVSHLLRSNESVLDSDWEDVDAILLRVSKEREYGTWIEQERENEILIGPEHFKFPDPPELQFPPKPPEPLPAWRSTRREQRDWQERLETRIDQNQATIQAFREAVETVEEICLPDLRDALIEAHDVPGYSLEEWAVVLTDQILVDTRSAGNLKTNRISQAIETLQSLLWSLHTERLNAVHPDLSLRAEDFNQEWDWLGSYASWRSAMFVFLYPENILLPSLRRRKTPAFEQLVAKLRDNRMLSPEQACREVEIYADYLRDVCSLRVEATCQARTRVESGTCREGVEARDANVLFLFARPHTASGKVYWSSYDPAIASEYKQSFWKEVEGIIDATEIIGSVPYDLPTKERSIILFYTAYRSRKTVLAFRRFKLDTDRWTTEIELDDLPAGNIKQVIAAQQESFAFPPLLAILTELKVIAVTGNIITIQRVFFRSLDVSAKGWKAAGPSEDKNKSDKNAWPHYYDIKHPIYRPVTIYAFFSNHNGFEVVFGDKSSCDVRWHNTVFLCWINNPANSILPPLLITGYDFCVHRWIGAFQTDSQIFIYFIGETSDSKLYIFDRRFWRSSEIENRTYTHSTTIAPSFGPCYAEVRSEHGSLFHRWLIGVKLDFHISLLSSFSIFVPSDETAPVDDATWAFGNKDIKWATPLLFQYCGSSTKDWKPADIRISEEISQSEREFRRNNLGGCLDIHSAENRVYIEEGYYFLPMQIGLGLQRRGFFDAALNWYRTVYDFLAPLNERKIYPRLVSEESISDVLERGADWLSDPLDPHAIAETRPLAYTRFTLTSIIRCLLDYADSDFAKDSAETLERARRIYIEAIGLLGTPELKQQSDICEQVTTKLEIQIDDDGAGLGIDSVRRQLSSVNEGTAIDYLSSEINREMNVDDVPFEQRVNRSLDLISVHQASVGTTRRYGNILDDGKASTASIQTLLLSQPTTLAATRDLAGYFFETAPEFDFGYNYTPGVGSRLLEFCVPANAVTDSLQIRAQLNLYKLRTGRNIAGLERELESYSAPTDAVSGMPQIGAGGQVVTAGVVNLAPTPYRYQVLIERAKELAQIAGQMEAAMLSAIEKRDAEYYRLLEARQEVELTRAGIRLQDLRKKEAEDGVGLATLQQGHASIRSATYEAWKNAGLNQYERALKTYYEEVATKEKEAAEVHYFFTMLQRAETGGRGGSVLGGLTGNIGGAILGGLWGAGAGVLGTEKEASAKAQAIEATKNAQIAAIDAAFERRKDEWVLQKALADQDYLIAGQQMVLAQDRVQVVGQERKIAELQADHASDVVNYLTNKFTNLELYDWMAGILVGVYGYFLQQATAMARTAEQQLAFERQETPVGYLQSDYWSMPGEANLSTEDQGPDRLGLTGSARLLQDIHRLDLGCNPSSANM